MKLLCYILTAFAAIAGQAVCEVHYPDGNSGGKRIAEPNTNLDLAVKALSKDALRPSQVVWGAAASRQVDECMDGVLARINELKGQLEYIASIVEVLKEENILLHRKDAGDMLASTAQSLAAVNYKADALNDAVRTSLSFVFRADADLAKSCGDVERLMQELLAAIDEAKRELHVKPAKKKHADRKKSKKNVDADRK